MSTKVLKWHWNKRGWPRTVALTMNIEGTIRNLTRDSTGKAGFIMEVETKRHRLQEKIIKIRIKKYLITSLKIE